MIRKQKEVGAITLFHLNILGEWGCKRGRISRISLKTAKTSFVNTYYRCKDTPEHILKHNFKALFVAVLSQLSIVVAVDKNLVRCSFKITPYKNILAHIIHSK